MSEKAKEFIKQYPELKRSPAALVDKWFTEHPDHWREKAKEIFEQCQRYELQKSGPYRMGAGVLHPVLRCGWREFEEAPKRGQAQAPEQAEDLLTYYAACIILHDYDCDASNPKWTSISGACWLNCGAGLSKSEGLPETARVTFFWPSSNSLRLISEALRAVEEDLRRKYGDGQGRACKTVISTAEQNANGPGRAGEPAGAHSDMGLLMEKIRGYVRRANHREELRAAFDEAKREHPAILDWLEPYFHQTTKQVGLMEDTIPPRSVSRIERLLLCRVLVTICHDWFTGPDEEKIVGIDPFAPINAMQEQLAGDFGEAVYKVGTALRDNAALQKRVDHALADLEELDKKTDGPGAGNAAARANGEQIHIDLSQWKKGKCRNLMQDLLDDDLRKGVTIRPRRHGENQPKELRRSLRKEHELPRVAKAIVAVEGKAHTCKLTLSRHEITYTRPQT